MSPDLLDPRPDMTPGVIAGLGWLYAAMCVVNIGWTIRCTRRSAQTKHRFNRLFDVAAWGLYSAVLAACAAFHFASMQSPATFWWRLPTGVKDAVNAVIGNPVTFSLLLVLAFSALVWKHRWFARPTVAWCLFNLSLLFLALSLTDWDFRQIVGKPDNVPIVAMLYLFSFFMWLYFSRATRNDRRREDGRPLIEEENNEKVLVWPDLVYIELICMVAIMALLIVWAIMLPAPLEEPASRLSTPNPSKAPWYFLGLQELLVYFDPWLAGVTIPTLIILGLMAIPFLDFNPKGSGYYTFKERRFAIVTFLFGLLLLWLPLIVLGTFLRGPNWSLFGPYEYWDAHKLSDLTNRTLSQIVWRDWFRVTLPQNALLRELPGLLAVGLYLIVLPSVLAVTRLKPLRQRMGAARYWILLLLFLTMAALPVKMIFRWSFNLKYVIALPEWFLNF